MALDPVAIIGTLGFPIFVTIWFMYRNEKVLERNTEAINALKEILIELCEKVNPN